MLALSSEQFDALQRDSVKRRVFIWCDALDLEGEPDPAGFWDDVGDVEVDGRVYHGSGSLIQIGQLSGVSSFSIPGLSIEISGVSAEAVNLIRGNIVAQRPLEVYIGIYDTETNTIIEPLIRRFKGVVDDIEIVTGDEARILLTCESSARALTISRTTTRSNASCKDRYSTDRFYEYTGVQREKPVYFGRGETEAQPARQGIFARLRARIQERRQRRALL